MFKEDKINIYIVIIERNEKTNPSNVITRQQKCKIHLTRPIFST